ISSVRDLKIVRTKFRRSPRAPAVGLQPRRLRRTHAGAPPPRSQANAPAQRQPWSWRSATVTLCQTGGVVSLQFDSSSGGGAGKEYGDWLFEAERSSGGRSRAGDPLR